MIANAESYYEQETEVRPPSLDVYQFGIPSGDHGTSSSSTSEQDRNLDQDQTQSHDPTTYSAQTEPDPSQI